MEKFHEFRQLCQNRERLPAERRFHYTEEDLGVPSGSFTVTFNAWGMANIPPQTILQFSHVEKPEDPVRPGYIFIGWYHGGELWDFEFDRIRGDMTLEAKWANRKAIILTRRALF